MHGAVGYFVVERPLAAGGTTIKVRRTAKSADREMASIRLTPLSRSLHKHTHKHTHTHVNQVLC